MTTIIVGYDHRAWQTYQVKDATPEEIEILSNTDSDEALELARSLLKAGRLVEGNLDYDDMPDVFSEFASPAVIELDEEDA